MFCVINHQNHLQDHSRRIEQPPNQWAVFFFFTILPLLLILNDPLNHRYCWFISLLNLLINPPSNLNASQDVIWQYNLRWEEIYISSVVRRHLSHFPLNSKTAASGLGRQCKVIQLQSRSRLLASDQWQVYVYHCSVLHKLNWEEAYANPSTNWSAQLHRKEGEEENGWHDRMKTETAATHSHFPMCLCLMVVKLSPQWIYYSFESIFLQFQVFKRSIGDGHEGNNRLFSFASTFYSSSA